MPSVSKASATEVDKTPAGTIFSGLADGYEFAFFDLHDDLDGAQILKGLPGDLCPCPHWGYVTSGRITFAFPDRDETFEAGEAFYVAAGHTPHFAGGTQFLMTTADDDNNRLLNETMRRNLAQAVSD